jgi:hypothetical protein
MSSIVMLALVSALVLAPLLAATGPSGPALPADASFADSTQHYYAHQDVAQLKQLLQEADTRLEDFLCRYRLYPLTEDAAYVDDLPSSLDDGSARELALLSGLWSYRAGEASIFNAISYGRRSASLLETARAKDEDDPYVLLVGGQSWMFRPAIAGRNLKRALKRFRRLQEVVPDHPDAGIPMVEARLWTWYALHKMDRNEEAKALRQTLTDKNPPPLYAQFMEDPPQL